MKRENLSCLANGNRQREELIREMDETLSRSAEDLRRCNADRLQEAYAFARRNSPFYRELLRQAPDQISGPGDLRTLPFTTKEHLRAAYPFGLLAVPRKCLIRYGESTGSTGGPTSSFMTGADWERGALWVQLSLMNFYDDSDTVFIAIPYELSFAAMDIDRAFSELGATVVAVGTLNSVCPWRRTLQMMRTLHPSVLVCTPSRAGRVWDMFGEHDLDPGEVGLRSLLYIGETCSPSRLRKIAALWDVTLSSAYGATETNSLGLLCERRTIHLLEDRFLFEVLDPETLEPVAPGAPGELVLTTLAYEAMPLVRYRTGDIVELLPDPCPCGLPFRAFRHLGRGSDMIRVQGEAILRYHLEETVMSTAGTGHCFVAGARGDELTVVFDASREAFGIESLVEQRVAERHGVRACAMVTDRSAFGRQMDQMLKPGGLSLEQLQAAR